MDYQAIERVAMEAHKRTGKADIFVRTYPPEHQFIQMDEVLGPQGLPERLRARVYHCKFDGVNPRPRIDLR